MKIAIALLGSLATFAQQHSNSLQDPQLRARAIGLLEYGPIEFANLADERRGFQFSHSESGTRRGIDGYIKISVAGVNLKRWEITYGTYQFSQVQNVTEYATFKTGPEPAGVILARKVLPVNLVHFDETDIIRAITGKTMDGVPASCIDFDTIKGSSKTSGVICVDKLGYLIYQKFDETVLKQVGILRI